MSAEAEIVTLITGIEAVAELIRIGDEDSDDFRIAPAGAAEKMARPNIIFQLITARGVHSNDGATGLKFATMQVTCWADDYEGAKALAALIAAAHPDGIDGFYGVESDQTVRSILLDDERDAPEPPSGGQSSGIAGVVLDFKVAYGDR